MTHETHQFLPNVSIFLLQQLLSVQFPLFISKWIWREIPFSYLKGHSPSTINCTESNYERSNGLFGVYPAPLKAIVLFSDGSQLKIASPEDLYLTIIGRGWAKYRDLLVARRSIICQSRRIRQKIDLRDIVKSRYFAITEFNKCFIIRSLSLFFIIVFGKR